MTSTGRPLESASDHLTEMAMKERYFVYHNLYNVALVVVEEYRCRMCTNFLRNAIFADLVNLSSAKIPITK